MPETDSSLSEDLLFGVKEIARELGKKERQVYYELVQGLLPGGKSGNTWVASKRALRSHFAQLTKQSAA